MGRWNDSPNFGNNLFEAMAIKTDQFVRDERNRFSHAFKKMVQDEVFEDFTSILRDKYRNRFINSLSKLERKVFEQVSGIPIHYIEPGIVGVTIVESIISKNADSAEFVNTIMMKHLNRSYKRTYMADTQSFSHTKYDIVAGISNKPLGEVETLLGMIDDQLMKSIRLAGFGS